MKELYDTWSQYVYIDARHLGKEFLIHRFPTIYQKCLESGYHMEKDLIPVAPVEHYGIGGVQIDLMVRHQFLIFTQMVNVVHQEFMELTDLPAIRF